MSQPEASQASESGGADLSFEQAFDRLEAVVEEMENGQIPLADLIENYETGVRLHRLCQQRLEEAEGRIEIIREKVGRGVEIEPFEPDAAAGEPRNVESHASGDTNPSLKTDGELF